MSVGFVMLVHRDFRRAAQVVRFLSSAGAPVVVHVDALARGAGLDWFRMQMAGQPRVRLARSHACDWGMWPIVEATRSAAQQLLAEFPDVTHVALVSGACLPLRPVDELRAFLAVHPDTDFIESVATGDISWTVGGLEDERFSLWFPFSWKRQRRIFDAFIEVQRRLGLRRSLPDGLVPHIGSQWWCMTRGTLERIFADPRLPEWDRFFRRTWIPDESFFQTLARKHARRIESRSLTFARFDCDGRPHVFYDDHFDLLASSGSFFARKVWPGANRLYSGFLRGARPASANGGRTLKDALSEAAAVRRQGRPGLVMQGRFPGDSFETARPYTVIQGLGELFKNLPDWLSGATGATVHGRLMHPVRVETAPRGLPGGLSPSATLRDYDRAAFLRNLIWGSHDHQVFQLAPQDAPDLWPSIAGDPNARILIVTGAWAIGLWRNGGDFSAVCREAARLDRLERAQLAALPARLPSRIRVHTVADVLAHPMESLGWLRDAGDTGPTGVPQMHPLDGLPEFLRRLRNAGYPLDRVGEITASRQDEQGVSAPVR